MSLVANMQPGRSFVFVPQLDTSLRPLLTLTDELADVRAIEQDFETGEW